MNSSSFKRFKALPLPFDFDHEDISPLPAADEQGSFTLDMSHWSANLDLSHGSPTLDLSQGSPTLDLFKGSSTLDLFKGSRTIDLCSDSPTLRLDESSIDSGLGMESSETGECRRPSSFEGLLTGLILNNNSPHGHSSENSSPAYNREPITFSKTNVARRSLFDHGCDVTPSASFRKLRLLPSSATKRMRAGTSCEDFDSQDAKRPRKKSPPRSDVIKRALNRGKELNDDVIGDFSRPYCLPTHLGKHRDLHALSPETMAELLSGHFDDVTDSYTVIDCRYPYEFEGGHIKNALNLWNRDLLVNYFFQSAERIRATGSAKRHVVIFHCEFSSERGPKMMRLLRELDRDAHKDSYPALYYPEMYLLEGGYKDFYNTCKDHCVPQAYRPMKHGDHTQHLKYFRRKSKSCATGNTSSRIVTRRQRSFHL